MYIQHCKLYHALHVRLYRAVKVHPSNVKRYGALLQCGGKVGNKKQPTTREELHIAEQK